MTIDFLESEQRNANSQINKIPAIDFSHLAVIMTKPSSRN